MFSQFSSSEFEKNKSKSRFIHQYKCRCSPKRWWGSATSNICNKCGKTVAYLDLKNTIGIGWFECSCGRIYAGFAQGDITSKCHGCQSHSTR